jgi:hypothetical protein
MGKCETNGGYLYIFDAMPHEGSGSGLNATPLAAPNGWYLRLVAATNPSRPVFTPPQMLQDLIEFPRLLRDTGRFLSDPRRYANLKGIADTYLAGRFGWAPLIEDLGKLIDLQSHILKRTKELERLYSGRGLKRRVKFGNDTAVSKSLVTYPMDNFSKVVVTAHHKCERSNWGSIRWKPTSPPPFHPSDVRMHNYVRRIVFGLTPEGMAKGLWDVIPWTWLLGWFVNIGNYALAYSNTVPASHGSACHMSQVTLTTSAGTFEAIGVKSQDLHHIGYSTYSRKTREVSGVMTPGFNMPFMDMSRLSVLGALVAQRLRR